MSTSANKMTIEQTAAIFGQPSVLVNRFYVSANPDLVRLAFVDEIGSSIPPTMRGSFVMTIADFESLGEVITRTLREVKEKIQSGIAEAGATR